MCLSMTVSGSQIIELSVVFPISRENTIAMSMIISAPAYSLPMSLRLSKEKHLAMG